MDFTIQIGNTVNEGFITYQHVDKQQAVRHFDGQTVQQTNSTKVYTDHNENEILPINTSFCMQLLRKVHFDAEEVKYYVASHCFINSLVSENEIAYGALKVVKDTANWWYKPKIARDDGVSIIY